MVGMSGEPGQQSGDPNPGDYGTMEVASLQAALGVQFENAELLHLALTHRSLVNERPDEAIGDNERLEFLGDAVLGAAVADELHRAFPNELEGSLTHMRISLVRREGLARWAHRLELGRYLTLGRGEEQRGGRERDSILASCLEAVLGAVYLDQGYERLRAVVAPLVATSLAATAMRSRFGHRPAPQMLSPSCNARRRRASASCRCIGCLPSRGPSIVRASGSRPKWATSRGKALAARSRPRSRMPPARRSRRSCTKTRARA